MPQLIEHIDAIARNDLFDSFDYERSKVRKAILAWLDGNGVPWQPCGHIASPGLMIGYRGEIYIDVPFDESDESYRKVRDYLENSDGSMKFKGATFCYLPLAKAMENAHHDEPGFWEKWAEDF
jgi:hypothetical protein